MEEFSNQTATEKTKLQNEPLQLSKINLEFEYGQLNLSEKTSGHCNFAVQLREGTWTDIINLKKNLRFIRHTDNVPRENRQNIELPDTRVART